MGNIKFNIKCSKCGESIDKDGRNGVAIWGEEEDVYTFSIVHKGMCDDDKYPYSCELIHVYEKTKRKKRSEYE